MINNHTIRRRAFLRGIGVSLALPWLESVAWAGAPAEPAHGPPKRFAAIFHGDGISPPSWWAKGSGGSMELGQSLKSLLPYRERCTFITGLFNAASLGVDNHPGQTGNILSGARLPKGQEIRAGISLDQVIAQRLGEDTAVPSLVLSADQPNTGFHFNGYSLLYSSHISWAHPTAPVPLELYPAMVWDQIFDNRGAERMRGVLDRVGEHARALQTGLPAGDRQRLDEYLTSVREIERRIERARARQPPAPAMGPGPGPGMPRPDIGMPADLREPIRLMLDLIAIAFQTDRTRVATMILNRDLSYLSYPFLGLGSDHHGYSHQHDGESYAKIVTFNVEQFAYLLGKLSAMHEGEGTVLDNSSIVLLTNMWSGGNHDSRKLPVITAGGLAAGAGHGRVLDYVGRPDPERRLCSLYLSLLDGLGLPLDRFGDSTNRLAGYA